MIENLDDGLGEGAYSELVVPLFAIKKSSVLEELFPPLGGNELREFELSLAVDGMRNPLTVWDRDGDGTYILVDGYNRFRWLQSIKGVKEVRVHVRRFEDGERGAICWALANQVGRRNLSPQMKSLYIAELYRLRRKQSSDKKAPEVIAVVATEVGVSEAVVKRAISVVNTLGRLPSRMRREFFAGRCSLRSIERATISSRAVRRAIRGGLEDGYEPLRKYVLALKVLLNLGWEAKVHIGMEEWSKISKILEAELLRIHSQFNNVPGIYDMYPPDPSSVSKIPISSVVAGSAPLRPVTKVTFPEGNQEN